MRQESGSTVPTASDPLAVTPARMREMATAIVELLAEEEAGLRARPVVRRASPEELAEQIAAAPPEQGRPFEQVLDELRANVLPFGSRLGHPAYFDGLDVNEPASSLSGSGRPAATGGQSALIEAPVR